MKLIKWHDNNMLDPFDEVLNSFFNNTVNYGSDQESFPWQPAVDVIEEKEQMTIRADLPGLSKDNIEISIKDGYLKIIAEKRHEKNVEDDQKRYITQERSHGQFQRIIALGSNVDEENIKAHYQDGVLEVKLPIKKEAESQRIQIQDK